MAQQMQEYVEARRIARMSHEPSDGPDEMVARSFLPLNGVKPASPSPFPTLRPNSQVDRQQQAQQLLNARSGSSHQANTIGTNNNAAANGRRGNTSSSLSISGAGRAMNSGSPSGGAFVGSPTPTALNINSNKASPTVVKERIVLPAPSSRWYPLKETTKPVLGEALDPNVPSSVDSPRAMQRATQRTHVSKEVQGHFLVNPPPGVGVKKKRKSSAGGAGNSTRGASASARSPSRPSIGSPSGGSPKVAKKKGVLQCAPAIPSTTDAIAAVVKYNAEAASAGQPYVPNNLKGLMAVLRSFMDDSGRLSPVAFTKALRDMGVGDASTADNIFRRLESRSSPGFVHYGTAIAAFHEVLNGSTTQELVASACFNLFDLDNRGYVHKAHLQELKHMRVTLDDHPMCTPHMVKVLTDLFNDLKGKEEDHYVQMVIRKGKKSSKKKPPPLKTFQNSVIPVERSVVQHIDRRLFMAYFGTHREVALAFAPRWIPLIDTNDAVGVAASEAMMRYENPPSPRVEDSNPALVSAASANSPIGGGIVDEAPMSPADEGGASPGTPQQ